MDEETLRLKAEGSHLTENDIQLILTSLEKAVNWDKYKDITYQEFVVQFPYTMKKLTHLIKLSKDTLEKIHSMNHDDYIFYSKTEIRSLIEKLGTI